MEKKRKYEIRFIVSEEKHKELLIEAKKLDIPLATYIKIKISNGK